MRTRNRNHPSRLAVLKAFRANPCATVRQISAETGLSATAVYSHLVNLDQEGVIKRPRVYAHHRVDVVRLRGAQKVG